MTSMFKIARAGRFLLTGIFLLTLIFPAQAFDVVNNNPDGDGSLAWAVQQVNAGNGSTITVSPSVKTLHLSRELTLTRGVTITGNGALIEGEETRRLFRVTDGRTVFSGLSFTKGNAQSGNGGAVEVDGSGASAEFLNCILYGNKARDYGGAVCVTRSDVLNPTIFRNCTITANTSANGAGLAVSAGTAHIFSSIVTGNSGNDDIHSSGGTIYTRYNLIGSTNASTDPSDRTGQVVSNVLVSENGVAKVETFNGISMVRITKSSPAYNFISDAEYSSSYDIAGTVRPQFGAYDAGAYEIPAVALSTAGLRGVPYMKIGNTLNFSLDIYPETASLNSGDFPPDGIEWKSSNSSAITAGASGVTAFRIGSADVWAEVHGWDSQGKAVTVPSNAVRVYVGEEDFSELRAEISGVSARMLVPGETATIKPEIHVVVDRYELDDVDGLSYVLTANSSRPEIVSVDVTPENNVRLKAGNTEGESEITLYTNTLPYEGKKDALTFTVFVEEVYIPPISPDVESGDTRGVGRSSGGCNSGIMLLAGIMAVIITTRKGKYHAE